MYNGTYCDDGIACLKEYTSWGRQLQTTLELEINLAAPLIVEGMTKEEARAILDTDTRDYSGITKWLKYFGAALVGRYDLCERLNKPDDTVIERTEQSNEYKMTFKAHGIEVDALQSIADRDGQLPSSLVRLRMVQHWQKYLQAVVEEYEDFLQDNPECDPNFNPQRCRVCGGENDTHRIPGCKGE